MVLGFVCMIQADLSISFCINSLTIMIWVERKCVCVKGTLAFMCTNAAFFFNGYDLNWPKLAIAILFTNRHSAYRRNLSLFFCFFFFFEEFCDNDELRVEIIYFFGD